MKEVYARGGVERQDSPFNCHPIPGGKRASFHRADMKRRIIPSSSVVNLTEGRRGNFFRTREKEG